MQEPAKILICEDERLIAMELETRLRRFGHEVAAVVSNGIDALEVARSTNPDLALMDIRLEGELSGVDVAGILKNEFDVPSIYLTAFADEETVEEAKSTEPLGYLLKPVQDRELRTAIEIGLSLKTRRMQAKRQIEEYRKRIERLSEHVTQLTQEQPSTERETTRMHLLTQVAGGFAHHLNNKLLTIVGNLEWLAANGAVRQYELRHIRAALAGCDEVRELLQRFLYCSGQGLYTLSLEPLSKIVQGVIDSLTPLWFEESVEVEYRCATEDTLAVVDAAAVRTAVLELLLNARQASMLGGDRVVQVSLDRRFVERPELKNPASRPGWHLVLTVHDNGPGIRAQDLDRVKEPFFSANFNEESLGLGLSVANGVAFGHDGWLDVQSAMNQGTTVSMFIPSGREH